MVDIAQMINSLIFTIYTPAHHDKVFEIDGQKNVDV